MSHINFDDPITTIAMRRLGYEKRHLFVNVEDSKKYQTVSGQKTLESQM